MAKFRKKPVVVDAEEFYTLATPPRGVRERPNGSYYVVTAHGQETNVRLGDWIIAEPAGRGFYPCKPDIFSATYEAV